MTTVAIMTTYVLLKASNVVCLTCCKMTNKDVSNYIQTTDQEFNNKLLKRGGPGSVVGIATAYGLDDPGIESQCGRDFPHLSRPALRPTQPSVQ